LAIISGHTDTEKRLLSKYPKEVKTIEDIPKIHQEFKIKTKEKDTGIFAFFRCWNKKRQLDKFEKNQKNHCFTCYRSCNKKN